jgi:lipid-binding SYLF domain-containing protein
MQLPKRLWIPFLVLFLSTSLSALDNDDYRNTINLFSKSPTVQPYFKNAYGYAVFPWIGKGGAVIGAAHGKGRVYRNHKYMGSSEVYQLSLGAQIGGQAYSQVIFFKDKEAYREFTSESFEFDASASAVLVNLSVHAQTGSKGRSAGASSESGKTEQLRSGYINGMAVFTHVLGGLMYEAAIEGQQFTFEADPRRR